MNTKTIIAGIITGILGFLLGWLIFGILLMDYYSHHTMQYAGLMKNPPEFLYIFIGSLAYGLLMAYIFVLANINNLSKGAVTGLIITALIQINIDSFIFAEYHLIGRMVILVDVIVNAVFGTILGAFLGWWLGRGSKKA
ncbi:MAG: hypothetical protein J0I09_09520 [Sphingobacteriia bacterium]|nr:hypothetical protein [Sphingobacteriia bacterium]